MELAGLSITAAASSGTVAKAWPYGAAIVVLGFVAWAAQVIVTAILTDAGTRSSGWLLRHLAGVASLRGRQLRRYRRAIVLQYATHPRGFGPQSESVEIRGVYVPLQYRVAGRREDLYAEIRDQPRSVVTGPAGAGKSLLLKHSMLVWAAAAPAAGTAGRMSGTTATTAATKTAAARAKGMAAAAHAKDRRVPVLIELNRWKKADASVLDLVVAALELAGVKRPRAFAEKALRKGRLRLLLDGLDEVGSDVRGHVIETLTDFARQHRDCQMVVTCRDAVYRGQLGDQFPVVEVADFDDSAVRRLLSTWPGLDRAEAGSLFDSLTETPQLMHLARSPLLLTMIAYLYVEVLAKIGKNLPSSRARFYEMAVSHFVDRDDILGRGGKPLVLYNRNEKIGVLKRLALAIQTPADRGDTDRTSIPDADAMAAVTRALDAVNLPPDNARLMLNEIVERSQLVVAVGGLDPRFVFTHLTFQEYLAALALGGKPDVLLAAYQADPDGWREVVKLWCGTSAADCTALIRAIAGLGENRHRILALECLAETSEVDPRYSGELIAEFLGSLSTQDAAAVRALGAVAAAGGPRGSAVVAGLSTRLGGGGSDVTAALQVLSTSGLRSVAETLAGLAPANPNARAALRAMGEVAIGALSRQATAGSLHAVDDLASIATPAAALALVPLLDDDTEVAARSAWRLAVLLRDPDIEQELRGADPVVTPTQVDCRWIWQPFAEGPDDGLSSIAGRIVTLLAGPNGAPARGDIGELDSRLALPALGLVVAATRATRPWKFTAEVKDLAARLPRRVSAATSAPTNGLELARIMSGLSPGDHAVKALNERLVADAVLQPHHRQLVERLAWPVQSRIAAICARNLRDAELSRYWTTVLEPLRRTRPLWMAFALLTSALLYGLMISGFAAIDAWRASSGDFWLEATSWPVFLAEALSFVAVSVAMVILDAEASRWTGKILLGLVLLDLLLILITVIVDIVLGTVYEARHVGWPMTAGCIIAVGLAILVIARLARRRTLAMRNPFRYCLDADDRELRGRTSVIAR